MPKERPGSYSQENAERVLGCLWRSPAAPATPDPPNSPCSEVFTSPRRSPGLASPSRSDPVWHRPRHRVPPDGPAPPRAARSCAGRSRRCWDGCRAYRRAGPGDSRGGLRSPSQPPRLEGLNAPSLRMIRAFPPAGARSCALGKLAIGGKEAVEHGRDQVGDVGLLHHRSRDTARHSRPAPG